MGRSHTAENDKSRPGKPAAALRERLMLPLLALMVAVQFALAYGGGPTAAWVYLRLALGLPEAGMLESPGTAALHPLPKIKPDLPVVSRTSPLLQEDEQRWHPNAPLQPVRLEVWENPGPAGSGPSVSLVHDVDALNEKFAALGYDLREIRSGAGTVPHAYLRALPRDLPRIRSASVRKSAFIKLMLPLVLRANAAVLTQRQHLLRLCARLEQGERLASGETGWMRNLIDAYGVKLSAGAGLLEALPQLKRRVDVVPPSMAIAQSAEESGWGTSRFAVHGNAVYGQWSWRKGSGIVPMGRDEGKTHEIRAFQSLQSSVNAYVRNLNTHWAYKTFRKKRAALRREDRALDSNSLIDTLTSYSERGTEYVETLRTIIRVNRLEELDTARLHSSATRETRL